MFLSVCFSSGVMDLEVKLGAGIRDIRGLGGNLGRKANGGGDGDSNGSGSDIGRRNNSIRAGELNVHRIRGDWEQGL